MFSAYLIVAADRFANAKAIRTPTSGRLLRVIAPSEVKAKMEALRDLGVQMDMQDRSQLN